MGNSRTFEKHQCRLSTSRWDFSRYSSQQSREEDRPHLLIWENRLHTLWYRLTCRRWLRDRLQKPQISTILHHCDGAFHINSWMYNSYDSMTESVGCFLNLLAVTVTGPFCRMLMRFITSIQSLRDLWKQSRAKLMMHDRWHQGNWCSKGLVFQNRLYFCSSCGSSWLHQFHSSFSTKFSSTQGPMCRVWPSNLLRNWG